MKSIIIEEAHLKQITLFLIENKVILHPQISPSGIPNFTGYENKNLILILDRNLVVRILRLITTGELKDKFSQVLIGALLFWVHINNVSITAGLALTEYAHFNKGNSEASLENTTFLSIFKQYNSQVWLDLALDKRQKITPVKLSKNELYNFSVEGEHYKMHYLEMLKLSQLYNNEKLSIADKLRVFYKWIYDNILICKYTTCFAILAFSGKTKMFNRRSKNFEEANKKCINQSWDLTYLSFWSTMYYFEENSDNLFLFATHDKELKELFIQTNKGYIVNCKKNFKPKMAKEVIKIISQIYGVPRSKPEINSVELDKLIQKERKKLKNIFEEE